MKWILSLIALTFMTLQGEELILKKNLQIAKPGDYLAISCNKTITLMHIHGKNDHLLTIEEIAIPENKLPSNLNWKEWVAKNAPGNTSWVMYEIDLQTGQMGRYYSFTKNNWYQIPDADNFLSKLLNLKMTKIPDYARKRIGPKPSSGPDLRPLWQPRMFVDGNAVQDIQFDAWKTDWPKDGTDLSNKTIEVYLPTNSQKYPSYFPYWLQINAVAGKAKIRIIDSGKGMKSPKPSLLD